MSTVHISLHDIFGVAAACEVIFRPADTPTVSGMTLTVSGSRSIRLEADGTKSVWLQPGRYSVRFLGITSNADTLSITVPNDQRDYNLTALINAGALVVTPAPDYLSREANLADVKDRAAAFGAIKQEASVQASGVIRIATQQEVDTGTDTASCVTPYALANDARWGTKEPVLSNPQTHGEVLTSTPGGDRGWMKLPRVITVNSDAERLALDPAEIKPMDWVKVLEIVNGDRVVWGVLDGGLWTRLGVFALIPQNTGLPSISGSPRIGAEFSATPGEWTDMPTRFTFQWQRAVAPFEEWSNIEGATLGSYVGVDGDAGARIRVEVRATNEIGTSLAATSPEVQIASTTLADELVAYWGLDEESGPRADSTGNGHDLSDNNWAQGTQGKFGNAVMCTGPNGNGEYLSGDLGSWLDVFTASWWARSLEPGAQDAVASISFWNSGNNLGFGMDADGYLLSWGGIELRTGSRRINDGDWHHIVTRSADGVLVDIFIDGVIDIPGMLWGASHDGGGIQIGLPETAGLIDNAGLWSRALSDEEIGELYNNGNGITYPFA